MCCIVDLDALFRVEFTDKRTRIGLMMYCSPLNNASIFFWGGGVGFTRPARLLSKGDTSYVGTRSSLSWETHISRSKPLAARLASYLDG